MAGICNAICFSASTAENTWSGWILIEEFSKGRIQAMKTKTLTIQLNDEQLCLDGCAGRQPETS